MISLINHDWVTALKPPFKNRPNNCVTLDGKPHFIARDCAVVAQVFLYDKQSQTWYVLLGKRGSNVPDFQGFWGFPCGYLDWDETLYEAVLREVWEETGLVLADLPTSKQVLKSHNLPSENDRSPLPWKISDNPSNSSKQNISHHFSFYVHWHAAELPALTIEYAETNEAEAAQWVSLEEAKQFDMAFNHTPCLIELLEVEAHHFDHIIKV